MIFYTLNGSNPAPSNNAGSRPTPQPVPPPSALTGTSAVTGTQVDGLKLGAPRCLTASDCCNAAVFIVHSGFRSSLRISDCCNAAASGLLEGGVSFACV